MNDQTPPRRLVVVASAAERDIHYLGVGAISDYLLFNTSGFAFSRVDSSHAAVREPIETGFRRLCAESSPAEVVVVDSREGRIGLTRRLDALFECAEQLEISVTTCVVVDGSEVSVAFAEALIDHVRYRADQLVIQCLKVGETSRWEESALHEFATRSLNVREISIANLYPDQLQAVDAERDRFGHSPSLHDLAKLSLDKFAAERSKRSWQAIEQQLHGVRSLLLP